MSVKSSWQHAVCFSSRCFLEILKKLARVVIEDETPADILSFLSCLLPHPTTEDVEGSNLHTLIRLGDKFQTPELKKKVVNFLKTYLPTCLPQERMELLVSCDRYNVLDGVRLCVPYCQHLPFNTLKEYHDKVDRGVMACLYAAKLNTALENAPRICSTVAFNELKASVPCFFCSQLVNTMFKCCKRVICSNCKFNQHKCKAGESYVCDKCGVVCLLRKDAPGCKCLVTGFEDELLRKI